MYLLLYLKTKLNHMYDIMINKLIIKVVKDIHNNSNFI